MADQVACPSRDTSKTTMCCHSTETCCEGACCNSGQACVEITSRNFAVQSQMVNTQWINGNFQILNPGDPGYSGAFGGGAWNSWKMIDGSTSQPWHMCSPAYLGAVATTRVIILPIVLFVAIAVGLVLVLMNGGIRPFMVAIPAIILLLCSIFLFFSIFWQVAIVISLGALFGMGAVHKGGLAVVIALLVELFALAVVTNGLGLGSFFYNQNLPDLWAPLGGPPSAHSPTWLALSQCSNYYDFFAIDPNNRPYTYDPTQLYTNYCSDGWYTYIGLVADVVVMCQIIMLVATGVHHLRGGSTPPPKSV